MQPFFTFCPSFLLHTHWDDEQVEEALRDRENVLICGWDGEISTVKLIGGKEAIGVLL